MAKKKGKGGVLSSDAYNESNGTDDTPDWDAGKAYVTYSECMDMQNSQNGGDMISTPNSRSGQGIIGGPAPGEPNPADVSTEDESH